MPTGKPDSHWRLLAMALGDGIRRSILDVDAAERFLLKRNC